MHLRSSFRRCMWCSSQALTRALRQALSNSAPSLSVSYAPSRSFTAESEPLPAFHANRPPRPVHLYNLTAPTANDTTALVQYSDWLSWQQQLVRSRSKQMKDSNNQLHDGMLPDVLLLLQHPPTYTLGRASTEDNLKFKVEHPPAGSSIHRIDRGGEVTYHEPGQLVIYPILNLRAYQPSLHWYIRSIETLVQNVLARMHIDTYLEPGLTGVWSQQKKVAAIGLNASRWITSHGAAINVTNDMQGFKAIVPCGIEGREVTSVQQLSASANYQSEHTTADKVTVQSAAELVMQEFQKLFHVEFVSRDINQLNDDMTLR